MSQVVTLADYIPAPRYDDTPWTEARIEEGTASVGPWTLIDTITLDPVDDDPTNPQERNFTTDQASDDLELWYRVTFADGAGATLQPTVPVQNVAQSVRESYAELDDLARVLHLRQPTNEQTEAMARVLAAAADEIDAETGGGPYAAPYPALVVEVNLERAVEHWKQQESAFGILGLGAESEPVSTANDSWNRHAHKLSPLKETWGVG